MVRRFRNFIHQALNIGDVRAVGGDRDSDGVGVFMRKRVERLAGGLARAAFARCDVHFRTPGL